MNNVYYQQGDVIIEQCDSIPEGMPVQAKNRGYVLAEGEATGHAHVIDKTADIEFVEKDGMFYLKNAETVTVLHEEHKPISIPSGIWRVRRIREYDHFAEEARKIRD